MAQISDLTNNEGIDLAAMMVSDANCSQHLPKASFRYDSNIACHLVKPIIYVTKGNHFRSSKRHVHYDLRKDYFGNRIIFNWKSLPDYVINANLIGIIERSLDRFWSNQACLFDYKADLIGTTSRSQLFNCT